MTESSGQLFGKYELLEKIGAGGMAEIFKARAWGVEGFEKILCVKRVLPVYAKNRAFIEMLVAEAKVCSLLQHANVVQIFDLGSENGQFYIVMEYVEGGDMLQLLTACAKKGKRIPTELALFVVAETAKGLAYAHEASDREGRSLNIIHRDVSPSNVLISLDGDVKVVDFGVARADLETSEEREGGKKSTALKGKLGYMSPELVTGGDIDHRSDIFALGIVLWEVLTLRRLFLGKTDIQTLINIRDVKTAKKFRKHDYIDQGIYTIINKALTKDPEERFQTATDLQEAILDYLFEARMRVTNRQLAEFVREMMPARKLEAVEGAPAVPAEGRIKQVAMPRPEPPPPEVDAGAVAVGPPDHTPVATEHPQFEEKTPAEGPPAAVQEVAPAAAEAEAAPTPAPAADFPVAGADAVPDGTDFQSASFRVRSEQTGIFGPVTYHNLQSLIRNRGITADEYVSINDGDWIRVGELKLPGLDTASIREDEGIPLFEGPVSSIRTPQLLYELAVARVVGKLKMSSGSVVKEVYFQQGVPAHINSNVKSELLANFMLERNLIGPNQLTAALGHVRERGGRLGDALVAMGLLKPHDLFRVVELQFRSRFNQLFSWRHGWYEFYEGKQPPGDVIPINDSTVQLIAAGVRTAFDLRALREIFEAYLDQVVVIHQNPHITHHAMRFNSRELRLYTYLETGTTLRDVLTRFGRTEEDRVSLLQVIFVLHQCDLLSFRSPRGVGRPHA